MTWKKSKSDSIAPHTCQLLGIQIVPCVMWPRPRQLESLLRRLKIREWIGQNAVIEVKVLDSVRDWQAWTPSFNLESNLCPTQKTCDCTAHALRSEASLPQNRNLSCLRLHDLHIHMHGALLDTSDGIHSFSFIRRHGALA